jgi:predicted CoA-binding protein
MQCEFPTINEPNEEIKEILQTSKSVAIIGCSPNETKDSNKVAKYLLDKGYIVYPVYPKEDEILGQKVYRSLLDIPYDVDIVDIFRKPAVIMDVVKAAIEKGNIKCIWSQLGLVNNEAMQLAKEHGMKTVQNHCTKIEYHRYFDND